MPEYVYKWEEEGALVHHCWHCSKALSTPQAKSRCLGTHVEPCKRYHSQLFPIGNSHTCHPCIRSDEEHIKRHREIVELLHQLKKIKDVETPPGSIGSLGTPDSIKSGGYQIGDTPTSKKGRKAAKKAKKLSMLPKPISTAEIDLVAKVLHPHPAEDDEAGLERHLLKDLDAKLHDSSCARVLSHRDVRDGPVRKTKNASLEAELTIDASAIDGLLQLLNVSPLRSVSTTEERTVHAKLRSSIENDLIKVAIEAEEMIVRKAGFWRWASKRAYKRHVRDGRIWIENDLVTRPKTAATASTDSSTNAETDDTTEPDTDVATPTSEEDGLAVGIAGLTVDSEEPPAVFGAGALMLSNSKSKKKQGQDDDGWTTVGNAKIAELKLKEKELSESMTFSANGGLNKMASPVTRAPRRRGFATSYDHLY